jgi:hypothetical protein
MNLLPSELRRINHWRFYFQVNKLSDITNAAGTEIKKIYRRQTSPKDKSQHNRQSKLNWPRQEQPGPLGHTKWAFCISTCFLKGSGAGRGLRQPLGDWLVTPATSQSKWHEYIDVDSKVLFVAYQQKWKAYKALPSRSHRTFTFPATHFQIQSTLPPSCIPTESYTLRNALRVDVNNIHGPPLEQNPPPNTLDQYFSQQEKWVHDLNRRLRFHNEAGLLANLRDPSTTLSIGYDGGLPGDIGTFGIACGSDSEIFFKNMGLAHGSTQCQSSHRSESYGMLGGLSSLHHIILFNEIRPVTTKKIFGYCDNLSLVRRINKHLAHQITISEHYAPDIDVALQILKELEALTALGFDVLIKHVIGHQDKKIPYCDLPRPAQLNVLADEQATEMLQYHTGHEEYCELPANKASLAVSHDLITSHHSQTLRAAYLSQDLRALMTQKFCWHNNIPDKINWRGHGQAIRALGHNDRMRIQKAIHSLLPTNHQLNRHHPHIEDRCATCTIGPETDDHILQCSHPLRTTIKDEWLIELSTFLREEHTPRAVHDSILPGIQNWLDKKPTPSLQTLVTDPSQALQRAFSTQSTIGWNHFIRGRLASNWTALIRHQLSLKNIDSKHMTAASWNKKVIGINYQYILKLWTCRNKREHGSEPDERHNTTIARLLQEAEYLKEHNNHISHVDHDWFYTAPDTLATFTVGSLRAWLYNAKSLLRTNNAENA